MDALERERGLIAEYDELLRQQLPEGADVFDVHVHLGLDIDGFRGDYDELERIQSAYGISGAFVFCLDEPDRHPAFRAANDRTLEFAERSGGRLIPFVRLDITEKPIQEATRAIDAGARGIKLHPRAQKFDCGDERLDSVFELAADRKVPILIHGGRGLPPIADHLSELVDRYAGTQLIIAHAGIADQAGLFGAFSGREGVYFDTSVWSPLDLINMYQHVSPEQVLYASDYPYGQQPGSLIIALRTARAAGLNEEQVRGMLAGNARRIINGEPWPTLSPPRREHTFAQPIQFARIHQYLAMATPLLWTRQPDTIGVMGLALNASLEQNGFPDERERIRELLETAQTLWKDMSDTTDEDERRRRMRATFRMVYLADILAVTVGAWLTVNGGRHELDTPVGRSLASVLREDLGLTGTKIGCNEGHCGACTVQLDGVPVLSCITLAHLVGEREVTTIEGLRDHPLIDAFVRADALQCGFCTPGQIVSAAALVEATPQPDSETIRHGMAGNLCRCGTYTKIEEAIATWRD